MVLEHTIYWDNLRAQSLRPGGFGKERVCIWPSLLGVHVPSEPPPYTENSVIPSTDDTPHPDERQVRLDTDRSFVIYSADDDNNNSSSRESLQSSLNGLIVSLLRKRRKLHYFQGYHDIVTVIFLTLPPELQLPCIEKLSLHRVRDSMGPTLEPVLGLLRIMRNLLRIVDPQYARLLESVAPLPFHALSNLLTLFSHEVPTLPLIQHVWDFLLCREPLAVVWLAAAVVLTRKPDVIKLAAEDEDGMIHSVLNALPLLEDGSETNTFNQHTRSGFLDEVDKATFSTAKVEILPMASGENVRHESPIEQQTSKEKPGFLLTESGASYDASVREENVMAADTKPSVDDQSTQRPEILHPALFLTREAEDNAVTHPLESHVDNNANIDADINFVQPLRLQHHTTPSCTAPSLPRVSRSGSCSDFRSSPSVKSSQAQAPISLSSLLTHAAQLLEAYPPTLPELHVEDILGPKSVVHTWRPPLQDEIFSIPSNNECDDEAESWVGGPDVVMPIIEDEENEAERKSKTCNDPVAKHRRQFRLPHMRLRFGVLSPAERRVLLVGAIIVVGLAITLRQNRTLADMKKGWVAWVHTFVRCRTAI